MGIYGHGKAGNIWAWQGRKCMHVCVLMNNFIITTKQIIMLCSKFTQLEMLVKIAHCNGGSRMGHLGQMSPLPPCGEPAMLLIKIATKLCQAKISLSTHENMHILLAFITNSPEIKASQSQTSCKIVIQHLRAY